MEKIKHLLRFLRFKLIFEKCLKFILFGFLFDLIVCFILIILSKYIFIYNLFSKLFLLFVLTFILILVYYFIFKKPSYLDAAYTADSIGFKERFITAFNLYSKNKNNIYFDLILKDIEKSSKDFNLGKQYKIKIPYKNIILCFFMALICISVWVIPFEKEEMFAEINAVKDNINFQREILKDNKKELINKKDLKNKNLKSVNEELNKLDSNLKKADSIEEAVESIQKTQYIIKEIDKNSTGEITEKVEKLNQSMADASDTLNQNTDNASHFAESKNEDENKNNYQGSENLGDDKNVMVDGNLNQDEKEGNGIADITGKSNQEANNKTAEKFDYDVNEKDVALNGIQTESGNIYQTKQKTNSEKGDTIDYKQVYSQYKNEAMRSLNEDDIPDSMKDIVKNYFSELD